MKNLYPKTNDSRLIGHLKKIFGLSSDASSLAEVLNEVDLCSPNMPVLLSDCLIVYDTFPVFGEFMFPKPKSLLWNLLESTEQPMLLTDAMVQGADSLLVCQILPQTELAGKASRIVLSQAKPSLCVNTYKESAAMMFSLMSLRAS